MSNKLKSNKHHKCIIWHEEHWKMLPTALMLTPHCHPRMPLLWSYDPLCGYDCSMQAESGTQDYAQPFHLLHSNVGSSLKFWCQELPT